MFRCHDLTFNFSQFRFVNQTYNLFIFGWVFGERSCLCFESNLRPQQEANGNPRSAILLGSVLRKVSINTISEAKKFIQDKICKGENEEHLKCSCFFCPSFWTWFKSWDSNMSFIEIYRDISFPSKGLSIAVLLLLRSNLEGFLMRTVSIAPWQTGWFIVTWVWLELIRSWLVILTASRVLYFLGMSTPKCSNMS